MKDDLDKLVWEFDGVKAFYFRLDEAEISKRVCECKHADRPSWDVQVLMDQPLSISNGPFPDTETALRFLKPFRLDVQGEGRIPV